MTTTQFILGVARAARETRRWQREANAGGLSVRREYEGAVLPRVVDLKTFAPLVEGGVGGRAPTIVNWKLMVSRE
jgi:hypothetical protein